MIAFNILQNKRSFHGKGDEGRFVFATDKRRTFESYIYVGQCPITPSASLNFSLSLVFFLSLSLSISIPRH